MRLLRPLVLATMIVACGTSTEPERAPDRSTSETPKPSSPESPAVENAAIPSPSSETLDALAGAKVAADAHYLVDPETGVVAMDVPPEILVDVRAQLIAAGLRDRADDLARLYDLDTGHVRDESKARATDTILHAAVRGGAQ